MTETPAPTRTRPLETVVVFALLAVLAIAGTFIFVSMKSQASPLRKAEITECVERNIDRMVRSQTTVRCV